MRPASNMSANVVEKGQSLISQLFYGTLKTGKAVVWDFPKWSITKHPYYSSIVVIGAVVGWHIWKGGLTQFKKAEAKPKDTAESLFKQLEILKKPETQAEKEKDLKFLEAALTEKQNARKNIEKATTDKATAVAQAKAVLEAATLKERNFKTEDYSKNNELLAADVKKAQDDVKAAEAVVIPTREELDVEIAQINLKIAAEQVKIAKYVQEIAVLTKNHAKAVEAEKHPVSQ